MMTYKTALVLGAGGFIGSHMVRRLKFEGYWVRGVDIKYPEFSHTECDHFVLADLKKPHNVDKVIASCGSHSDFLMPSLDPQESFDEIYQFAADMGGAGFIFTGDHDAAIMHNSVMINLNVLDSICKHPSAKKPKVFYSSSACVYPAHNQLNPLNPNCEESSAYPADPDSEYGWEKLFSERLYHTYAKNHGLQVRVARYHNVYGPEGTWQGGREKAPAAICRKVAQSDSHVDIWGDGEQTRSFLYIDACIEATRRFMQSDFSGPINIGSEEQVTINQLVDIACEVAGKQLRKVHIPGPQGVRGRNSDNRLIRQQLNWNPAYSLREGMQHTYAWIHNQIKNSQTGVL
jgi:nucleoside-diphosphate-sugar epimerase